MKCEKINSTLVINKALDHIRHDNLKKQLEEVKRIIFEESNSSEKNFNKILDKLPDDVYEKCKLDLDNLIYAIGRIRALSMF